VVVIGASGFLGGALVHALRATGRAVRGVGRRAAPTVDVVCDLASLASAVERDDIVVNAAGVAIKDAPDDVTLIRENLRIARAAADAADSRGARLVLVSSADIWPVDARPDAREDMPVLPDTAYGLSKLVAEQDLAARPSLRSLVVRPTYVYGPGMFEGRVFASVVKQASAGEVVLRGDPKSRTDYVFIDDVTRGLMHLIDSPAAWADGTRTFHLASGTLTSLEDLVRSLVAATGREARVRWEASSPARIQQGPLSTQRMRELGFTPRHDLSSGCAAFVASRGAR
jgi:UDP-glucose 4-epimerase